MSRRSEPITLLRAAEIVAIFAGVTIVLALVRHRGLRSEDLASVLIFALILGAAAVVQRRSPERTSQIALWVLGGSLLLIALVLTVALTGQ